ncbi:malate synthase A [Bradymonadaceae bacterium TMQ3]|uniref:Malate synthase n=1 Tax=Lujinxingia sediminis TaxID=2480984 RepID=A0ABY0CVE1_9DELT|nr:malate synthase A [Bradymonadaceae bacterium TMQ3]RVU47037.1 malate synthase A [Lujinxingia sediminis]TXC74916.1 malate synthase A [Bradymonadales bacterium TMQ1]
MQPSTEGTGLPDAITILGDVAPGYERILSPEALGFVAALHREFEGRRRQLLADRRRRQEAIDSGANPGAPADTRAIRQGEWQVARVPQDMQRRTVEITGPVDRKMIINALNSGADSFMADFEDATSPTWSNVVEGQSNLFDAVRRQIDFRDEARGKDYKLDENPATLMVRPRGWHLPEKHVLVDGQEISASLFDFGLYVFHNAKELVQRGSGPYFYLPKLESHREAALWNDVFVMAQQRLGIETGTIKATVLVETIHAAFEMEEILYALREHSAGLNAGRWDYIFSVIKTFRARQEMVLPDRAQITMEVPFMRAYAERLVHVCHKRGAHAIGGMAAFIPSRRDEAVNERALAAVRGDKEREAGDGFDGTWVAHPDLVAVAREPFEQVLKGRPHQKDRRREVSAISDQELLNFRVAAGRITEEGLRTNINVGLQYIAWWMQGLGAVALYNLMEDAATAEISRSQIWQWLHRPDVVLDDGRRVDRELYKRLVDEELLAIREAMGSERYEALPFEQARQIFDEVATSEEFPEFFTLVAYQAL